MGATAEKLSRPGDAPCGRRRATLALKLLISLALLFLIAGSVDLGAVMELTLSLPLWSALVALASAVFITLVSSLRWFLVLRAIAAPLPLGRVVELMFVGNFFTQVLPTSVGGDAVRIWQASRQGIGFHRAFSSVMLERATGLLALVLMVVGGVLWLGAWLDAPALRLTLLASLPVLLAGLALLCLLDRLPATWSGALARLPLGAASWQLLCAMAADARRVLFDQPLSLYLLALSFAAQLGSVLAVWALARGLGLELAPTAALAVVPAVILITFIPLSFAGWGLREGATVVMFGFLGFGAEPALAVSVLLGIALFVAGLPGCWLWLREGRRLPAVSSPA